LFVVYEINKQVLPTAPSPTTTHLNAHSEISGCDKDWEDSEDVLDSSDDHLVTGEPVSYASCGRRGGLCLGTRGSC
jgi:hypothetical protein